ncbi:MAG: hypothetical protein ACXWWD_01540 [Chitinophagaceae bacterium]
MKLKFGFFLALMIAGVVVANAQGSLRRTVEERVQAVHAKMDSAFKLDTEKQAKADSVFANYYKQQDKIREEMRSGGERPDFQAMREKMQPALDARDKELKTLLTDEQFKKWKEEIEPALMPRRGGGNRK